MGCVMILFAIMGAGLDVVEYVTIYGMIIVCLTKEINHHEYKRRYKGYSVFSFFTDNGILCYTQHAKQNTTDTVNMNRAIQAYIYKRLIK